MLLGLLYHFKFYGIFQEPNNIGSSYNRSAKPFAGFGQQQQQQQQPPSPQQQYGGQQYYGGPQYGGSPPGSPKRAVPNVVHAQFNSPIGLYSAGNIAHTYAQQTAGIQKEMEK